MPCVVRSRSEFPRSLILTIKQQPSQTKMISNRPVRNCYSRFKSPPTSDESGFSEVEPHLGKWTGRTRGRKPLQSYNFEAWAQTIDEQIEVDDTKHGCRQLEVTQEASDELTLRVDDKSQERTSGIACKPCRDRHRRCEHTDPESKITYAPPEEVDLTGASARGIKIRHLLNHDSLGDLPTSITSGIKTLTLPTATGAKAGTANKAGIAAASMEGVKSTVLKMEQGSPQVTESKTILGQNKADSIIDLGRRITDIQMGHQSLGKEISDVRQRLASLEERHASQNAELAIALAALAETKQNHANSGTAVLPCTDQAAPSTKTKAIVIDLEGDSTDSEDREDSSSSVEIVGHQSGRFRKEVECKRLSRKLLDAFTSPKQPATVKRKLRDLWDLDCDSDDDYTPKEFTPKRSSGGKRLRRSAFS